MSTWLTRLFLVHAVVGLMLGAPLLVAPGRWLNYLGWAPIDPIMSRMFGAALLGMAWSSYRGWRAAGWDQVAWLVQFEAIFSILASVGLLRHLLVGSWPVAAWLTLAGFLFFALAWLVALRLGKASLT